MATVYIGDIPEDVRQRDVEDFFRDYKIEHVRLRDRFGFVDFRSSRDADDAVRDLDGERMLGKRVRVEISEGRRGGRGGGKVFLLGQIRCGIFDWLETLKIGELHRP